MTPSAPHDEPQRPAAVAKLSGRAAILKVVCETGRRMFGLDLRSLALLRMGLAVCILADLWISGSELRAFYTDEGVLPRHLQADWSGLPFPWSLYSLGGGIWLAGLLFAIQTAVAMLLLIGWRTRLMTVLSCLLLCSLQARNPMVLYGADMMLRLGLFWAMFLPLGRRLSLDAIRKPRTDAADPTWLGVGGVAFIGQFIMIYFFNGVMKTSQEWRVDHTAVAYALSLESYGRPFGHWLNQFDQLTAFLTFVTLKLETYGPLLFVLPVRRSWPRWLALGLFFCLQLGFGITLRLGIFGLVMVVLMLGFIPADFWAKIAEPLGHRLRNTFGDWRISGGWREWRDRLARAPAASLVERWPRVVRVAGCARDVVLAGLLWLVLGLNIQQVPQDGWDQNEVVRVLRGMGLVAEPTRLVALPAAGESWLRGLGLGQRFSLFAPGPSADDGWFVARAQLPDGRSVDLLSGVSPATLDKPVDVADTYHGSRWLAYTTALMQTDDERYLAAYAEYLERRWNRAHPTAKQVVEFEIVYMRLMDEPGQPPAPAVAETIWPLADE